MAPLPPFHLRNVHEVLDSAHASPTNQRHLTWEEMVQKCRHNRRQAAILESRDGPQIVATLVSWHRHSPAGC